jgi:hypothetical protein
VETNSVVDSGLDLEVVAALEQVQYAIGFEDGQRNILNEIAEHMRGIAQKEFDEMKIAAETFYRELIKIISQNDVIEHRIGYDSDTEEPATLTIISGKCGDKMEEILKAASACELAMYRKHEYSCYFWVITDEKLDQPLIEHDFPYLRKSPADVNI